jgi:predicted GNAT family N-acyltransferase
MPEIEVVEAAMRAQRAQAFAIRRAVFVKEQGIGEALEFDARDDGACHLLALRAGAPVGTLRLRFLEGGVAKIERVAVVAAARSGGVGQALLRAALARAEAAGATEARLHAQTVAQAFYARLGYVAHGPTFKEDGIAHVAMRRPLGAAARPSG